MCGFNTASTLPFSIMSAILKQLQGDDIPAEYRHPDRGTLFQVVADDGEAFMFTSELDAAAKVVELTEHEAKL
ncbi:hypothetical protein SAMN05216588_102398 [Pseudomonas flavescens]|uniref:Uncharacterized protein n=1 Tax=Phytopseudomonas flavescens TaxID=29435 RepID=A0A1G7ZLU7_9GAMM|nr:hypothetical protein [Pseudomonas flavescens]SDH09673.1 hypothetical protein SAMN05216588_102398 [Pseudomonas flavescens]